VRVGKAVGVFVGDLEGVDVGMAVGDCVGDLVGGLVGVDVGAVVGDWVGVIVGPLWLAVHSWKWESEIRGSRIEFEG